MTSSKLIAPRGHTASVAVKRPLGQQAFIHEALERLGMEPAQLAERLLVSPRLLECWMLPSSDPKFKDMDEGVWRLIRELLDQTPVAADKMQ